MNIGQSALENGMAEFCNYKNVKIIFCLHTMPMFDINIVVNLTIVTHPLDHSYPCLTDQTVIQLIGLASGGMGLVTSLTSLEVTLTTWDRGSTGFSLISVHPQFPKHFP